MEAWEFQEEQDRALALRQAGLTYEEIAAQTKYASSGAAFNGIKAALERRNLGDKISDQRVLEMFRFDALQRAYWRQAMGGDVKAAQIVLQIMEKRAKLLGLQGLPAVESPEDPLDELAARRDKKGQEIS